MQALDRLRSRFARPAIALLVPLTLATAAYWRVLDGELQFDDAHTIERNFAVKDLGRFVADHVAGELRAGGRPLTDLTFALNYAVGGLRPWNFHATSLAIHLATVVLVWALGRAVLRLAGASRAEWLAVAVAGLFALHPLQSQAVSYVSQRAEVLASELYVATLLLLLAAERRGLGARAAPLLVAALATFLLALGAKPIAVTLPAAWILVVLVAPSPERRAALPSWRRRAVAAAPFAAIDALFIAGMLSGLAKGTDAGFAVEGTSPGSYVLTELRAIAMYLRLLFWPAGQRVDWNYPFSRHLAEPAVALSGLLLLGLAAAAVGLAWWGRRRNDERGGAARVAALGVLWFLLVLSPTSSFVPVADALVEHRAYLASWGVFAAGAVAVERLFARAPSSWRTATRAALPLFLLLWTASAVALHRRNAVWETRRALWADCLAKSPRNPRAEMGLAHVAMTEWDFEGSIRWSLAALEHSGGDPSFDVPILRHLGATYIALGRFAEGEAALRRGLDKARWEDADALNNLAQSVLRRGDVDEAEPLARRAAVLAPASGYPWNTLGEIALRRGDPGAALRSFARCNEVDPDLPFCWLNRGLALASLDRVDEACATWAAVHPGEYRDVREGLERMRAQFRCPIR